MNDHIDALDVGVGYALAGTLFDAQTERIEDALAGLEQPYMGPGGPVQVEIVDPKIAAHNAAELAPPVDGWDDYVGQEKLKRKMYVHATSAKKQGKRLPHTLFASNLPGVGKTHMSRLCASLMGVSQYELVPPFNIYTIVDAAMELNDHDILFIDEIHKLSDNGQKGAEILLKILEEGWAPLPSGVIVKLPDITIVGATTDKGRLPETVQHRFKIRPHFEAYSYPELAEIAIIFGFKHEALSVVDNEMAMAIALACRGTPRLTEEMIIACQDLAEAIGRPPTPEEMLEFVDVEPDGMGPEHIRYLTGLRTHFRVVDRKGNVEYRSGEPSLRTIVREDKDGLLIVERFLIEKGYVDKTPQGRRLTESGIARAEAFIAEGRGVGG